MILTFVFICHQLFAKFHPLSTSPTPELDTPTTFLILTFLSLLALSELTFTLVCDVLIMLSAFIHVYLHFLLAQHIQFFFSCLGCCFLLGLDGVFCHHCSWVT